LQLKEFNIMLDIKKSRKIEEIEVVQGDTNTNILYISIVESLVPYDLAGITVEIVFAKPDGTTVVQDATNGLSILDAAAGKIKCVLLTNTIAAPGRVNAEVRLLQNDKLLTSARFEFYVRRAIMNDETIESTNEFPVLTQLIQEVQQITAQVPEEVVNNLNALTTYVNELAGQGRTTETVKQNADDIVNLSNDLATHKAENVTDAHGFIYEEGTWTPKFGTTFNGVYGVQNGSYIRKGNEVTLFFELEATTFSYSDESQINIYGLPFFVDNTFKGVSSNLCYGKATNDAFSFEVVNPSGILYGYKYGSNRTTIRPVDISSNFYIKGEIVYKILV